MAKKTPRKPSPKKSEAALKKVRVNGRFVAADPKALQDKKEELERVRIAQEGFSAADKISEEDREKFGEDSLEFLKVALSKAPTWYEGLKYAKELKNLQYPSLQAVQSKQELEITQKVFRWEWGEEATEILDKAVVPQITIDKEEEDVD